MREIRTLRLTRRRLETEPWDGMRHRTRLGPDRKRRLPVPQAPRQPPTLPPRIQSELALLGYTVAETARLCQVPINTVRSRLATAKAALRKRLEEDSGLEALVRGVS